MGTFDREAQERRVREQEDRAWGIARESYDEFVATRGRGDLSEHHLCRLERMLALAEQEERMKVSRYARRDPRSSDTFERREVEKSMGIEADHAWIIADRIRDELRRRLQSEMDAGNEQRD